MRLRAKLERNVNNRIRNLIDTSPTIKVGDDVKFVLDNNPFDFDYVEVNTGKRYRVHISVSVEKLPNRKND